MDCFSYCSENISLDVPREYPHILAVKHNSPYQFIDIEGLFCVLSIPVHCAPCDGGQVLGTKPAPMKVAVFRQSIVIQKKTLFST